MEFEKELLKEIEEGIKALPNNKEYYSYYSKGIGTRAYIVKRIDVLRESLLSLKKIVNTCNSKDFGKIKKRIK